MGSLLLLENVAEYRVGNVVDFLALASERKGLIGKNVGEARNRTFLS
jgi:hypothetical protein